MSQEPVPYGEKKKLVNAVQEADLLNRFTYHAPRGNQPDIYDAIRRTALKYAQFLVANCPEGRELSLAITRLEEVVFWANASVARKPETQFEPGKYYPCEGGKLTLTP